MPPVPIHDLWRHEADKSDPDRVRLACAVRHLAVKDHVRRDQCRVFCGICAAFLDHVCADNGKIGSGQRFHQEIEPIIEFVVAKCRGFEAHRVHRGDDRVHVAFFHPSLIGDVIAHGVALQKVAIVQQQRVRRFGADLGDMRRSPGKAYGVDRLVAIIIVRPDVHVQVGGFHDPQMRLSGLRLNRERMQRGKCGSRRGKEYAAAHIGSITWQLISPRRILVRMIPS